MSVQMNNTEEDLPIVWIVAVCAICGANVYTVNMEPHMAWHETLK